MMQQRTNQVLYAYWNDVRGQRIAPRRFDVEPSQLGAVLSETFILEGGPDQPVTFRLAGTRICEHFGREFRGLGFMEMFQGADRETVAHHIRELQAQGAVALLETEAALDQSRKVSFEILLLPLIHTGTSISRFLGAIVAVDGPGWLGSEVLPKMKITAHRQIWPDGRPFAAMEKFMAPPALIPELAGARLVRIKRRSFRVLDGGLEKS